MTRKSTAPRARKTASASPEAPQFPPDTVLVGRLVADPVLRTTKSGMPVSTIRIAVNASDAATTFHNVIVWKKTAEAVCRYLAKGRLVEVRGRAQERQCVSECTRHVSHPLMSAA